MCSVLFGPKKLTDAQNKEANALRDAAKQGVPTQASQSITSTQSVKRKALISFQVTTNNLNNFLNSNAIFLLLFFQILSVYSLSSCK